MFKPARQRNAPAARPLLRLVFALAIMPASEAVAKLPGGTHCHNAICHRVLSLTETAARIGFVEIVIASHYGAPGYDRYNPRTITSSGEIYDPKSDATIASPIYPDGTRLVLWNPANGHAASVRVTNAGPYMGNRTVDTSEQLARRLGFYHQGVARLHALVVAAPSVEETRYRKGRTYPPVPGYLGMFEKMELAVLSEQDGATALIARDSPLPDLHPATAVAGFSRSAQPARSIVRYRRPPSLQIARTARRVQQFPRRTKAAPGRQSDPPPSRLHCVLDTTPSCN